MRMTLAAVLALGLCGCKKSPPPIVPVTGVVTLDGQPLPHAEVRFYPQQDGVPGDYIAIAVTDDNGKFTLDTNGQPGACACLHKVTVSEGPAPDGPRNQTTFDEFKKTLKNRPIPLKFGNLDDQTLAITVSAGQSHYPIELTR